MTNLSSSEIRKNMRRQRSQISEYDLHKRSQKIANLFVASKIFNKAKIIASFESIDGEQSPHIINKLAKQHGKIIMLPIVQNFSTRLRFGMDVDDTIINKFGIKEPRCSTNIPLWMFDVVLLPLTAFDDEGNRLGMGGGFYDHSFDFCKYRKVRPLLIGVAHALQKTAIIQTNEWDVPLDYILTEQQLLLFNKT